METETKTEPVPAATVMLTRENEGELQVYLLRRSRKSTFMGGFYVFPGGRVDPEDREAAFWQGHSDLSDFSAIIRGALDVETGLSFAVAAIRETYEEAGVLLVDQHHPGNMGKGFAFERRRSGGMRPGWLKEGAGRPGCSLAVSTLLPWSHWITPAGMKYRFDTRFFIVKVPAGQACRPDNAETTHGLWVSPEKGLISNLSGRIPLSPPTLVSLQGLMGFNTFDQIKGASQANGWGRTIMPRLIILKNAAVILEPWDPWYQDASVAIDTHALPENVLGVGEPFSRLWNDNGLWKPVGCPGIDCHS